MKRNPRGNIVFASNDQGDRTDAYAYLPDAVERYTSAVLTNTRSPIDAHMAPGEAGFTILLHEIGHALGLKHPGHYEGADDTTGDRGLSLATVAQGFIDSPEFSSAYGARDNTAFVTRLYMNVLGRQPDAGGLAFHVHLLERGDTSRNVTLLAFAESDENQQALAGVIGNGFAYTPFGA